jgi:hypothetical protein
MDRRLIIVMNHIITEKQNQDARICLGVKEFTMLPNDLKELWCNIPPDQAAIGPFINPVIDWICKNSRNRDFVLIQGDFGACYLAVRAAFEKGLIPVYSTTFRKASERPAEDGSICLTHCFSHRIFRQYGK